jgi:hypothetical protein
MESTSASEVQPVCVSERSDLASRYAVQCIVENVGGEVRSIEDKKRSGGNHDVSMSFRSVKF